MGDPDKELDHAIANLTHKANDVDAKVLAEAKAQEAQADKAKEGENKAKDDEKKENDDGKEKPIDDGKEKPIDDGKEKPIDEEKKKNAEVTKGTAGTPSGSLGVSPEHPADPGRAPSVPTRSKKLRHPPVWGKVIREIGDLTLTEDITIGTQVCLSLTSRGPVYRAWG